MRAILLSLCLALAAAAFATSAGIALLSLATRDAAPVLAAPAPPITTGNTTSQGAGLPDLTIASIGIDNIGAECLGVRVFRVTVQNIGDAPAGDFVVTVNTSPQTVTGGLGAGQSVNLNYPGWGGTVIVDDTNVVTESNESNNSLFLPPFPTFTPSPTCTAVPTATFTPSPTPTVTPIPDADGDGIADTADNCLTIPNPDQLNKDGNFNDNSPPYNTTVDDKTWADSDAQGDACDTDDDNDGLADTTETAGPPCASATATTNPLNHDSDGDRYLDGIECALATDPASAASKPLLTACGPAGDTDGDKLSDRIEVCLYGTDPNNTDTDGDRTIDGAKDGCEAASFNGDRIVNVADMGMLAAAISNPTFRIPNIDVNKDGAFNPADQGLVASFISPSGQCP